MERSKIKLFSEIINISLFSLSLSVEEYNFFSSSCLSLREFFSPPSRGAYLSTVNTLSRESGALITNREGQRDDGTFRCGELALHVPLAFLLNHLDL